MLSIFYALILSLIAPGFAYAETSLLARMEQTQNSIVKIKTVYVKAANTPSGKRIISYERNGIGIIISPGGLIVTNTHTIINAPHIFVTLNDGTKLKAQVAYVSPTYDFSFLKVQAPRKLPPISFTDSSQVKLGQEVLTIGNSGIDRKSILAGQVASIIQNRSNGTIEFIEVTLDLHQGDSGGPILDKQGKLLGIVMAKEKGKNRSSVAIASDKVREQYLRHMNKK